MEYLTYKAVPKTWPVRPLRRGQEATGKATCNTCGLSWDDGKVTSMTPTPSARCPFEYFHLEEALERLRKETP